MLTKYGPEALEFLRKRDEQLEILDEQFISADKKREVHESVAYLETQIADTLYYLRPYRRISHLMNAGGHFVVAKDYKNALLTYNTILGEKGRLIAGLDEEIENKIDLRIKRINKVLWGRRFQRVTNLFKKN